MEENLPEEPKRSLTISVLIAVILLLTGAVAYFILIKNSPAIETANDTATLVEQEEAKEMETSENEEVAIEETGTETPQEQIEEAINRSGDIDDDLSKLDELDLSSPESDLGDDKLGDL